jgi:glutaredoxin-like protein
MITNIEGNKIPETTFHTLSNGEWRDVTTAELFNNRRVVLFSLPGAFTPTCSSTHLPRYNVLAAAMAQLGVDEVLCLSVNDGFVMEAWSKDQEAENVRLLPDGNGDFTRGMGMLVDKSDLGFGPRSWRYSMVVNDGIIEKMFIEPEVEGDPFQVSDADTMWDYLATGQAKPSDVTVFTKPGCPHCARAKGILSERGMNYEEITLGSGISTSTLRAVANADTVPQIFIDGRHIGSADDLEEFMKSA